MTATKAELPISQPLVDAIATRLKAAEALLDAGDNAFFGRNDSLIQLVNNDLETSKKLLTLFKRQVWPWHQTLLDQCFALEARLNPTH